MLPVETSPRPAGRPSVIAWGAVLPLALLLTWWAVSAAGLVPARRLPSPDAVLIAALDLAQRGVLFQDLGASLVRVLLGFAIGAVSGLLMGTAAERSRVARRLFSPLLAALRAVPTVAWLPVLLLYLGVGEAPKVGLIAIGAALPVFVAQVDAPPTQRSLAVMKGLRQALSQSWAFLITAELIYATAGLGFLLVESTGSGRADRMLVGIVLIVLLARSSDLLLAWGERRLTRRSA